MEKSTLIEIKDLTVDVFHKDDNGKLICQNVYSHFNYTIYKGERIIFIDQNGNGKSLLFDLIFTGFNNYLAMKGDGIKIKSGSIVYDGGDLLEPDCATKRRPFVYIMQDDAVRTNSTVISSIYSECSANGIDTRNSAINQKIDDYLKKFKLYKKKNNRIGRSLFDFFSFQKTNGNLSFGERRAVNIISKLITIAGKDLLLIDEPLNHLSYENAKCFNEVVNELIIEHPSLTILVISHCRGIDFATKEVCFNECKNGLIEKEYIPYNCFGKKNECEDCI